MSISHALLEWYDRHARRLPWRVPPNDSKHGVRADPYHVWLSEVMLQQTTVTAVKPYFTRFTQVWSTVEALAEADDAEVMSTWAGLGYYARARNMLAAARIMAAEGVPRDEAGWRALPGVGEYTAAAIAAIAFGERTAVVDGNVERVVSRLTADPTPLPGLRKACRAWMARETPTERPGDFVQAMMDLGATICTPKSPACALCPLRDGCAGRDEPMRFPVKAPKKARPVRRGAAFVAIRGDAVWLVRRPPSGLLGGMAAVPTTAWSSRSDGAIGSDAAPFDAAWEHVGTAEHGFTHFDIRLDVWRAEVSEAERDGWWSQDPTTDGLPTLFRKVLRVAGVA